MNEGEKPAACRLFFHFLPVRYGDANCATAISARLCRQAYANQHLASYNNYYSCGYACTDPVKFACYVLVGRSHFVDANLTPLYAEFGAAVHDAQTLEQGLRLAIALARDLSSCDVDSISCKEVSGLHNLVQLAKKQCLLDASDGARLLHVKTVRNELIHDFWSPRAASMFTPGGRRQILAEITDIRGQLIEAGKVVDRLVDKYLVRLGTSLDTVKAQIGTSLEEDDREDPFLQ